MRKTIEKIIGSVPENLTELETAYFVYLELGKILAQDTEYSLTKSLSKQSRLFESGKNINNINFPNVICNSSSELYTYILNKLGIKAKINTVVEPRPGLKGLVDRVKNRFRTEEGIRDVSWMINSAIITGTALTVASTVNNIIQARSAATPTSGTPNTPTSPEPTVSPEPTPIKATPQQAVQQPVSQYDGIRIGDGVGKYNVSTGHISSDRAVMGIDSKSLLPEYVNENSIFGRFASVNPDGSIGQVINTHGLSIEEFCAANGIDPSRVAVSVMDKAGVDQAWISASELVSGMGGPTL